MYKELPEGWKWEKLGEICKTTSGGTPSRGNKNYYNGNIPWVKSGELDKGLILDTEEKITEEAVKNSSAKIFPKGTLLIALYGATIGKLAFLGVEASTNQAICGIYESNNLDSKYLYNYLLHKKQKLVNQGIGGAQPNISQTILKNLDVPVPSLNTQNAIVSKIEELFSELDKGIENLKTAQQQLKVYRQSVLKWAFEGKLTNGLNPDSLGLPDDHDLAMVAEPQEIYESAKNQENQRGNINHIEDSLNHVDVIDRWQWKRLGDMFNFIGGGTPSKSEMTYWNGNIPWASVKDIKGDYLVKPQDSITEIGLKNCASNLANEGDVILITRISPGKAIITNIETAINQDLKIVKPKFKTTSKFVNYFFNAIERDCVKISSGTTVLGITLNNLNELLIPDLTLKEQNKIVQEIESRLSVADKMEETIQQSLLQAESLRQSILKKAFEGGFG